MDQRTRRKKRTMSEDGRRRAPGPKAQARRFRTSAQIMLARKRERLVMELRISGASYPTIAEQIGMSASGAQRAAVRVLKRLAEETKELADQVRQLDTMRLDRLLLAIWPRASRGDLGAVGRALDILERRAKMYGTDAPARFSVDWRAEAERVGLQPSDVFERMVQAAAEAMSAGSADQPGSIRTTDGRGDPGSRPAEG